MRDRVCVFSYAKESKPTTRWYHHLSTCEGMMSESPFENEQRLCIDSVIDACVCNARS